MRERRRITNDEPKLCVSLNRCHSGACKTRLLSAHLIKSMLNERRKKTHNQAAELNEQNRLNVMLIWWKMLTVRRLLSAFRTTENYQNINVIIARYSMCDKHVRRHNLRQYFGTFSKITQTPFHTTKKIIMDNLGNDPKVPTKRYPCE